MLKSHERFHSTNGKRLILVVDDELVNRELMKGVLQEDYELLFAENGEEALAAIRENRATLSLVLLDLMMPVMDGFEVLRQVKADSSLSQIPIIVITSDESAEVESLTLGAIDFIPKPYPQPRVIQARILRTIELSEDRQIINSTERDELTGLYNREYFYRYAEQLDQHHRNVEMDAIVVDVNNFHMINERFGANRGDQILRRISTALRGAVAGIGGIVCRREADTFLSYCPHMDDYQALLEKISASVNRRDGDISGVRLRMGVYANSDKEMDIERRFDRAKMAADTVQGSFTSQIAFYDSALHEQEMFQAQLIEDFEDAVKEQQFQVFFQPKFDIQTEIPVLSSAEALVRWMHPTLGVIPPKDFIPLFEENGLIQKLDLYVWRETAARVADWRDRFDFTVPVSVNVSRIDMYDPNLISTLQEILATNGLSPSEFFLEITESAYTQSSAHIIETVTRLRELGFRVEMDDFGTGYSSLNMISMLPIDALKMDIEFIRNAFSEGGDTKMLEVVIDIAEYLSIPVIAEGVETREQMIALREMGCDLVQGYYFSKPVPAQDYERFVEERKQLDDTGEAERLAAMSHLTSHGKHAFREITHALSSGYAFIYYVDTASGHYVEFGSRGERDDLQIETSGGDFFGEGVLNAILDKVSPDDRERIVAFMEKDTLLYRLEQDGSAFMTYRAMEDGTPVLYSLKAVNAHTHDDHHIVIGVSNMGIQVATNEKSDEQLLDNVTYASIAQALAADYFYVYYVNMENDHYIECRSEGIGAGLNISRSGDDFFDMICESVVHDVHEDDVDMFLATFTREKVTSDLRLNKTFTLTYRMMLDGVTTYVHLKAIRMEGVTEDHIVMGISNVDEQIRREQAYAEALRKANRDALTGVKSKYAYDAEERKVDQAIADGEQIPFAVVVCDINDLKLVNDTRGHNAGDQYIKDCCMTICDIFKHSPVFRIGGDEFLAILRGGDYEDRDELMRRLDNNNRRNSLTGGPSIAGGLGVFNPYMDKTLLAVFKRADAAMYANKKLMKDGR